VNLDDVAVMKAILAVNLLTVERFLAPDAGVLQVGS